MKRLLSLSIALALAVTPVFGQGNSDNKKRQGTTQKVKSAAANTGNAVRSVARSTGQMTRNVGQRGVSAARNTGQRVGNVARSTGQRVGSVAMDAGDRARSATRSVVRTVTPNTVRTDSQRQRATATNIVRQPVDNNRVTVNSFRSNDNRRDSDRDRDNRWDRDRDNRWDGDRHRSWSRYRYYHPPTNIYRNWDRGRSYSWNNHRYHWYGNSWVIIDPGYAYTETYSTLPVVGSSVVAQVQEELQLKGYDPGPADGVAGQLTRNAIAQFQRDNGLYATGRIDQALLNALDI